jgi:hypothetical protein
MGIYACMAKLILENRSTYNYRGKAVTLGEHHLNYNLQEVNSIFSEMNIQADRKKEPIFNERIKNSWIKADAVDAATLFNMIGFDTVDEIDVNDYEGASIIHDMNVPIPEKYHGNYDFVYDGGTVEHIFNIKDAMFNTSSLLKTGGTVVHIQPLSGWINHGFFQICPTFLSDYYSANGFSDIKCYILQINRIHGAKVRYWEVEDISSEQFLFNDFYCKTITMFFAKKGPTRELKMPIQGTYRKMFSKEESTFKNEEQNKLLARCEPRISRLTPQGNLWKILHKILPVEIFSKLHSRFIEKRFNKTLGEKYFNKI